MDRMTGKSCIRCGYELTGLGDAGRCPECGSYFNADTGEGLDEGGVTTSQRRGDKVVYAFQAVGLLFLALLSLGIGVGYTLKKQTAGGAVLGGVMTLLFLTSAIVSVHAYRKR